jgi:hypothetical protein
MDDLKDARDRGILERTPAGAGFVRTLYHTGKQIGVRRHSLWRAVWLTHARAGP